MGIGKGRMGMRKEDLVNEEAKEKRFRMAEGGREGREGEEMEGKGRGVR